MDPSAPQKDIITDILTRLRTLEVGVSESLREVYENQTSLKAGLDSAEFNLRSHQKVLNATAKELESMIEEPDATTGKKLLFVESTVVDADLRVDWAAYHQHVETDLVDIRRIEAERAKADHTFMIGDISKHMKSFIAQKDLEIATSVAPEGRERASASLRNFVAAVEVEIARCQSGSEDFSDKNLRKYHGLILLHSAKNEEVEIPVATAHGAEYPEGATVFGG